MLVSDFDFYLPAGLIAQDPLPDRSASRMLHILRQPVAFKDLKFKDFPDLLRPGDLLVVNNSRVFSPHVSLDAAPVSGPSPSAPETREPGNSCTDKWKSC